MITTATMMMITTAMMMMMVAVTPFDLTQKLKKGNDERYYDDSQDASTFFRIHENIRRQQLLQTLRDPSVGQITKINSLRTNADVRGVNLDPFNEMAEFV